MKLAIGCDHGGINLKPILLDHLDKKKIEYVDFGCFDKSSVDYNDYAEKVCSAVTSGECDLGILICGTGIGMSIVANKIKGIRCGHCSDVFSAKMTREHNDANVLAFGERVVGPGLMIEIVEAFLNTEFSNGERHVNRVNKIKALEERNFK
ncbi:MAG: ribose 5-phosphate isomerase B [Clostridiales bacterium]|nr:ribose 5-phosphate isomerase B [Clostridiales bacterium]